MGRLTAQVRAEGYGTKAEQRKQIKHGLVARLSNQGLKVPGDVKPGGHSWDERTSKPFLNRPRDDYSPVESIEGGDRCIGLTCCLELKL